MHAYFNKVPQGLASLLDFKIDYIEDIYFFEVNTKYISSSAVKKSVFFTSASSAVKKIIIFHECIARVKMLIFSPHEMKYIWYLPKKSKLSFYTQRKYRNHNLTFYLVVSRSI